MFQRDKFYMWHGKRALKCQSFRTIWRYERKHSKKTIRITDMYDYIYIYIYTHIFNAFKRGRNLYTDEDDGSPFC